MAEDNDIRVNITGDNSDLKDKLEDSEGKVKGFGSAVGGIAKGVAVAGAAVAALGAFAVNAATDFETSFIGVQQNVVGTAEEMDALRASIMGMGEALPGSAAEIAGIAAAMGEVVVQADLVDDATKTVIDFAAATGASMEGATASWSLFLQKTGTAADQMDEVASGILTLAPAFKTSEDAILSIATSLDPISDAVGFTQGQTLALSAAFASVGLEGPKGAAATKAALDGMAQAVANGGDKLDAFAATAGMTADEFKAKFQTDAFGATQAFLAGLDGIKNEGGNVLATLESVGLGGGQVASALIAASGAASLLPAGVEAANVAMLENVALSTDANKVYESSAAQFEKVKDGIQNAAIEVGAALMPAIMAILPVVTGLVKSLAPAIQSLAGLFTQVFTKLLPIIQPIIDALVGMFSNPALMEGLSALLDGVMAVFGAIAPAITALLPVIAQLAGVFGGVLGTVLTALAPVIEKIANVLVAVLVPVMESFVIPLVAMVGEMFAQLIPILMPLVDVILELVMAALDPLIAILPVVLDLFTALMPVILLIANLLSALLIPVVKILSPVIVGISVVLSVLIGWFAKAITFILKLVGGAESLGSVFGAVWGGIKTAVKAAIDFIMPLINALLKPLKAVAKGVSKLFGGKKKKKKKDKSEADDGEEDDDPDDDGAEEVSAVGDAAVGAANATSAAVAAAGASMKAVGAQTTAGMVADTATQAAVAAAGTTATVGQMELQAKTQLAGNAVVGAARMEGVVASQAANAAEVEAIAGVTAAGAAGAASQAVTLAATTAASQASSASLVADTGVIKAAWQTLDTAIGASLASLSAKFAAFAASTKKTMGGVAGQMVSSGQSMNAGLGVGLTSSKGDVLAKVGEVAGDIGKKVANFFGIHSPSTLFAGYGANLMEGMSLGLTAAAPVAVGAAGVAGAEVAAAAQTPAAAPAGVGAASGSSNWTLNIEAGAIVVQGSGSGAKDAALILEAIKEEMRAGMLR